MADLKSVGVRLYALNADYKKSMKESGDSTQAFGKVSGVALAAVGTAAAAFALKAADSYVAYGKTIMGLSRVTGESVETMSKLNFAANRSGISSQTLASAMKFLGKNIASGNAEFDKLGVSTKNADGSFRGTHDVLLDTADAVSKLQKGAAQTDAILKIFGRSGLDMGMMLGKGRDGILAMEGEAKKYGLVLTQDNIPAIMENIKAHRAMDAAMQGAQNQIGQNVLPVLTSAIQLFANLPGPIASSIAPLAGVTGGVILLSKATAMLGLSMGPLAAVVALVGGGYVLVSQRLQSGAKDVDTFKKSVDNTVAGAKTMDDLNRIFGKTQEQMHGLKQAADDVHAPWDVFFKKDLRDGTAALGVSLIAQEALRQEVLQYAAAHNISTDAAILAIQAERAKAKAVAEHGDAAKMTTEEIQALTEANKAENDALRASMDPSFAAIDAVKKLGEAKQKNAEAEWAVVAAQNNYNQAVLLYGPNSQVALDALWKLNDAKAAQTGTTNDLARANLDLDVAVNNLTTAVKTNPGAFDEAKATMDTWVAQGRITRAQADKIIYGMWLVKGKADELNGTQVVLNVQTQGLHDALAGFANLAQFTGAKINTSWNIGDIGKTLADQRAFWGGGARASGGPVSAGTPYLVGEKGPELFTPGASGNITANGKWGAWGGGKTVYEDGSYKGMPEWAKKAHDFAEMIQKQEALRAHPELQGRPGWGAGADFSQWGKAGSNPFAGWDPAADFSKWGTAATATARGAASSGSVTSYNTYNVTVQAPLGVNVDDVVRKISDGLRRHEDARNGQR